MSSSSLITHPQPSTQSYCHQLDPTQDPRWADLVQRHPKASVFHSVAWLTALRSTYGYEPVVFTTSRPTGPLENGLVFCRVNSWITGRRLVSLPFSDHCDPLCDSIEELDFLMRYLQASVEGQNWKYLEFRPINGNFCQTQSGARLESGPKYFLHTLSLQPDLDELFVSFDRDCIQRRVQRAERANLIERQGRSEELLKDFYRLFVLTRGRHRIPPTPYAWFRNLVKCLGADLEIRVAYHQECPVSAIVILRHKDTVYYKYGGSDSKFNQLGATPWLLWRAIVAGKMAGASKFDFGRTEEANPGLLAFKSHWVPNPKRLVYWKFPDTRSLDTVEGWKLRFAKRVFSCMPNKALTLTGRMIYRHIG
jgi:Acetyltransferase (GNAT) domain